MHFLELLARRKQKLQVGSQMGILSKEMHANSCLGLRNYVGWVYTRTSPHNMREHKSLFVAGRIFHERGQTLQ
jgi:hypothetical protein